MNKVNITIVDADQTYIEPLIEYFVNKLGREKLEITVITRAESLAQYLSTPRNIDIVLINRNMYTEQLLKHNIWNVFYLCETEAESSRGGIYKYIGADDIYEYVFRNLNTAIKTKLSAERKPNIILVYSPLGGCGKTTISLALAKVLASEGKEVLYISVDDIQNYDAVLGDETHMESDFRDVILSSIELNKAQFSRYLNKNGFYYIRPVEGSLLTAGYRFEDFVRVAIMAKKSMLYDYIVFDASSTFSDNLCGFMRQADINLIIVRQDIMSVRKIDKFMSTVDYKGGNNFAFLCNMYDESLRICFTEEYMRNKCVPRAFFKFFTGDNVCDDIVRSKEFSDYIELNF